jgi:hypothetical protein
MLSRLTTPPRPSKRVVVLRRCAEPSCCWRRGPCPDHGQADDFDRELAALMRQRPHVGPLAAEAVAA